MLLPTVFPALPVAPSIVSPKPRLAAPTTPPIRLVRPPTVLPTVEVTNLTPAVAPESCWPIGIAEYYVVFGAFENLACVVRWEEWRVYKQPGNTGSRFSLEPAQAAWFCFYVIALPHHVATLVLLASRVAPAGAALTSLANHRR
jgi:hypothetical protein